MLDDTLERFRATLAEAVEQTRGSHETLWALVATSAVQARDDGIPVEQLIVRLKGVWETTLHERGGMTDSTQQRLKQDIVTRVIKAYYMQ